MNGRSEPAGRRLPVSTLAAVVTGLLAWLIAALGLIGWTLEIPAMSNLFGGVAMQPITAIGLMLCGAGLLLITGPRRWTAAIARMFACVVVLMGAVTIGGFVPGLAAVTGPLVRAVQQAGAGRMSVMAAVNFIAVGIGILTLRARSHWPSQ